MAKTLELVFKSTANKEVTLTVKEPKDNLTLAEAKAVMENIISKNVFSIKGAELKEVVAARVISKDTVTLA